MLVYLFSPFQAWPVDKVWRIGSRLYLHFAFQTCKTQRELLSTDAVTTATNPLHYSGECWSSRVQQAEAGTDAFIPLWRSCDCSFTPHQKRCLLSVRLHFFTQRYLYSFLCLLIRSVIYPFISPLWTQRGSPAVSSHRILPIFCWLYTRRPGGESPQLIQRLSLNDICVDTCNSSGESAE